MKKVEVLSVGTELLMGMVANTNAQYISKRLPQVGFGTYWHSVVGDNPERLKTSLALAISRADVVIMTGGLGPTQDDLTKETVAEAFGLKLVPDEKSIEKIRAYFKAKGMEMAESNLKQGWFPENSRIMYNDNGTAPGCIIEQNGKIVFMLPGPPRELIPMFDGQVMPYLEKLTDISMETVFLRVVGIGESTLEKMLIEYVDGKSNPNVATYVKDGVVTVRITASDAEKKTAEKMVRDCAEKIKKILGKNVFTEGEDDMWETVFKMLRSRNLTMAAAESCTGGLIAAKMTSIPGSSEVFKESAVTYTNEAKMRLLGVKKKTLTKFGAVSRETALEMVRGISKISKADVCVSVTGLAGPGADEGKKVGLVYIGIKFGESEEVREFNFTGDRERIRTHCVLNAFNMIREKLSEF